MRDVISHKGELFTNKGRVMKNRIISTVLMFVTQTSLILLNGACQRDSNIPHNYVEIAPTDTEVDIIRKAANVTPSPRQLAWQEMELTAFVCFNIPTFIDRECGDGKEEPSIFNPTQFDARQWACVCKDAGMKLIIVIAKHHDGFCLWPSKYTEHSVKNSPWRNGKGDVVKEVADACREYDLKFGVYLSPWDRHEPTYGDSPAYNEYFKNQLRELLSNYGAIAEVWFDGHCGEGPNGKKQVYDWVGYYQLIRELQSDAVIAIMGPDVRWVGTESGYGRETEWSVVPVDLKDQTKIAESSQQNVTDGAFVPKDMMAEDLCSREKIKNASTLIWYPSEVDVSIRPGWFYHQSQDAQVKTVEKLLDIYYSSVGRNSVLLLNIPPDRRGLIHENDIKVLREWRETLDATFKENLAKRAKVIASNTRKGHDPKNTIDGNKVTFWMTKDNVESATLEYQLSEEKTFDVLMLQENIRVGQRVERFHLEAWLQDHWERITEGTTIGYKRLLRFPAVSTDKVRLIITESRTSPTVTNFGLFERPSK